jgi:hypothetical protein
MTNNLVDSFKLLYFITFYFYFDLIPKIVQVEDIEWDTAVCTDS